MKKLKNYLITYRARGKKDFALSYITLQAINVDDARREFWKRYMKFDEYGEPRLTILKIKWLRGELKNEFKY